MRNQPCLDELEVYGPDDSENLANSSRGATPAASSCLAGYPQHKVAHLNDGRYGNQYSWISAGEVNEWAQIQLPSATRVSKVVFSRDRNGQYSDRVPVEVEVQLSLDGDTWESVARVSGKAIDVQVAGQSAGIPVAPPPPVSGIRTGAELIEYGILGQEHAWLKTYGHADLSDRLVPYNGRVKQYPRHAADDVLPLAPLLGVPQLDGRLDDACWQFASRGVVRVAYPYDFARGPLAWTAVAAGHDQEHLFLGLTVTHLLSSHLAVISSGDGSGLGVLVLDHDELRWNTYRPDGQLADSIKVEGAWDQRCGP